MDFRTFDGPSRNSRYSMYGQASFDGGTPIMPTTHIGRGFGDNPRAYPAGDTYRTEAEQRKLAKRKTKHCKICSTKLNAWNKSNTCHPCSGGKLDKHPSVLRRVRPSRAGQARQ